MEENKDLNTENSCPDSNDPNCCASNAGSNSGGSGGSGKWKSIIFIIVLLAACAVAAHAIIAKNGTSSEKSACGVYNAKDCPKDVKAADMKTEKTCPKGASSESKDSADEIAGLKEAIKAANDSSKKDEAKIVGCSSKKDAAKIAGCSSKKDAAKMADSPQTSPE